MYIFILTRGHFFIAFRDGGGERGREREKYQCERKITSIGYLLYAPGPGIICTWTGVQTHNLDMCPDQESNPQPCSYRMRLQPTEPHQSGQRRITFNFVCYQVSKTSAYNEYSTAFYRNNKQMGSSNFRQTNIIINHLLIP